MMRRLLLSALLALTAAACSPRKTVGYGGEIIPVTDTILRTGGSDTIRFGRMHEGEIAAKRIVFDNRSPRSFVVTSYEVSCHCTELAFDNQPVIPGEGFRATVTFDARGERGWQMKLMKVYFSGSREPLRLFIEADVE